MKINLVEQVSMGSNVDEEDFYHEPDNLVIQSDDEELPSQVIESQVDQQDAVEDLFETEEDYLEDAEDTASTEASEYEGQDVKEPEISIHEGYEDIPEQDYNYHNDDAAENNYSDMTVVHVGDNDEYQYNISCNVCGVENCETHAFPSVKENYFVCLICSDIFPSQKHLALHSKIHSEMSEEEVLLCEERTKSLTCEFCGRVLSTKATLREHIMIHTGEKPHQCLLCGKSFRHKANLVVHVNGHAVVSTYKCKKCNKAFTKKIDFEKHLHVHVDKSGNPLVCKICNSVFKSQRTLYNHSQLHSLNGSVRMKKRNCKAKNPQFVCKICGRGLSTKNTLKEHMMIHSGEKPHECKICGRTIRHKANFIVHVQTHGQGKSFECDMCDEAFMRKSDLTQHKQLEHSKSKLLRCPICSEVFKSPQKFNRHMEIHESVVYMNETEELNEFEPHLLESYIE